MIIKSMSRKAPTFAQLAAYIGRDAGSGSSTAFVRNLYADGRDRMAVVAQFLDNYRYLPERKGGNALYHELIALEPQPHLSVGEVEDALLDLANRYCEQRAPHQLAWGQVHHDTEFPHIHLMISANAVRSDRRVRMERQYFAGVQRDLERWQVAKLPHLKARTIYGHTHEKQTPKQRVHEGEMVRRTGGPSRKQQVFDCVQMAMNTSTDRAEFFRKLQADGFELYQRGQATGIIDRGSGKRYRLKTLGLAERYRAIPEKALKPAPTQTKTPADTRAEALLRQRLEAAARDQLREAERDRSDRE